MTGKKPIRNEALDKVRAAREVIREMDNLASEFSGRSISGAIRKITGAQEDPYSILGVPHDSSYEQLRAVFDQLLSIYDLDGVCPNTEKMRQIKYAFLTICQEKGWQET